MLKKVFGFLFAVFLAFSLTSFGSPAYAVEDLNCLEDFTYQEEAQAVLKGDPNDPHDLDRDKDGLACETLPRKANSTETEAPSDSGTESGTLPETGVDPLVLIIGSTTLLLSGGIFLVAYWVGRRKTS